MNCKIGIWLSDFVGTTVNVMEKFHVNTMVVISLAGPSSRKKCVVCIEIEQRGVMLES